MFPANVGFLEDVPHVIFIEIMTLDRNGAVRLLIIVDVVVPAAAFQFVTGSLELFDRLQPWIHYVPPIIILYTKIHKSQ